MKKVLSVFAAMMLVGGLFAATATAAQLYNPSVEVGSCSSCETGLEGNAVGHIDRGCEGEQVGSGVFDFEDFGSCAYEGLFSYCERGKLGTHRALFELCACTQEGVWDTFPGGGDTIDVSFEIVVRKSDGNYYRGDNGVYWASNVGTVGVNFYTSSTAACADDDCLPGDYYFEDGWVMLDEDGEVDGDPDVRIMPAWPASGTGGHGLVGGFPADPRFIGSSVWSWVDIPRMYVDPDAVEEGWEVFVRLCYYKDVDNLEDAIYCGDCCCLIKIGDLCCPEVAAATKSMVFPYFTDIKSDTWWFGLAITNLTDNDGTATLTMYENDGDIFTGEVPVAAHQSTVLSTADLMDELTTTNDGNLGFSASHIVVEGDFTMTGFGMMGKASTGESMGYLPISK